MNLVDGIEAFVKIADLGSFAAAARELNISPSAVSKLVSKTEEELGTRLLNRNHQPVTARGDTWYKGDMNMGRSPVSVTRGKKIHYSMVMNKVTDKHNVLQEDRGIGKCMINRILWAVMN
ncbi:LysR family transcriptional regulator [Klebsiella pneumoniae]